MNCGWGRRRCRRFLPILSLRANPIKKEVLPSKDNIRTSMFYGALLQLRLQYSKGFHCYQCGGYDPEKSL